MNIADVLTALDAEIDRLRRVHALLSQPSADVPRRGRPPGSKNAQKPSKTEKQGRGKKRTLSAAGREAIAEAERKRHAKTKKVAVKRLPAKAAPQKREKKATKKATGALSAKAEVIAAPAKASA